jgi:hypothetical protein
VWQAARASAEAVSTNGKWARLEFKIQTKSKFAPNLIQSKHYHQRLQKIQIKYLARGSMPGTNFVIGVPTNSNWNLN